MSQPTYANLVGLVISMREALDTLRADNVRLNARVAELETQLRTSSRNSSKPPSTDGLAKPAPKSLRKRTGRKPGGQDNHEGRTLRQVPNPDEVIRHEPLHCHGCGRDPRIGTEVGCERRQVFDLPPIEVHVTEHQLITRRCRCGSETTAAAPERVNAPVQYGPRIAAVIIYLYIGQFLSKKRTAQALADLFNIPVSEGTVAAATVRAADELGPFCDLARQRLRESRIVHFDETGIRVAGKLQWLHSASTKNLSLFHVHPRRGTEAMEHAGILPEFTGTAVHDAWAPYDTYTRATHILCNAHLLRELIAVTETAQPGTWCWATQVIDALLALKDQTETAHTNATPLDPAVLTEYTRRIRNAATIAANEHTDKTKLGNKNRALARRIRDRHHHYLAFTTDPAHPFDNNAAEREIRMVKIRQKVSGCLRTLTGARHFATIRSYTATSGKHGINLYDALEQLTRGNPWLPQLAE